MFDRASRPTITESVAESADSAVELADYWSRPTGNWPSGYGPLASINVALNLKKWPADLRYVLPASSDQGIRLTRDPEPPHSPYEENPFMKVLSIR